MKFNKWYLILLLFVANIFVWNAIISETPDGIMTVSFLDVGQGDAIFIEAPNKNQVLIDGGRADGKALRELSKQMPFYDRFIDVVIATHPDADHIGGLIDVLENYKVGLVIDSGLLHDTDVYKQKEDAIEGRGIKRIVGRRNTKITLDEGVYLEILFPDRNITDFENNTASIIAQLSYGDHEFLFTGDAPDEIENYIAQLEGEELESEVLKAGHHGSNTSTGEMILGYAEPDFVIISAGKDNRYGHPHSEVMKRLESFDITILETSELGTITFETNGRDLKIE